MSAAEHRNIAAADALMGIMGFRRALAPHQERVVAERHELNIKFVALIAFSTMPLFAKLDAAERDRLERQSEIMKQYIAVLDERIEAFHA